MNIEDEYTPEYKELAEEWEALVKHVESQIAVQRKIALDAMERICELNKELGFDTHVTVRGSGPWPYTIPERYQSLDGDLIQDIFDDTDVGSVLVAATANNWLPSSFC